jgi:hypothetical protein
MCWIIGYCLVVVDREKIIFLFNNYPCEVRYFLTSNLVFLFFVGPVRWSFPIPCFGCGGGWFFGLGCFSVCVGMRQVAFLSHPLHGAMFDRMGRGWEGCYVLAVLLLFISAGGKKTRYTS